MLNYAGVYVLIDKAIAVEVVVKLADGVTTCFPVSKDDARRILLMLPEEQLIHCSMSSGGYLTIGD